VLFRSLHEAGLPPGVFNLVQGGGEVGARLAAHPEVDVLFFTGSAATGERVKAAAGSTNKLVALELGGKNAALVLPDAPWEKTVKEIVHGAFATSGQRCSSTSRVLLHRRAAAAFLPAFLSAVDRLTVGYFTDQRTFGPLINEAAVERFLRAQKDAERVGFQTLREGTRRSVGRRGHYVGPSVHLLEAGRRVWARREAARPYWDQELFAPDVAIYVMNDEEEMVEANNASRYGLVTSVFTRSERRFHRMVPLLETGVVHWNRTTAMTPGRLPFGGWKASGNHWPAGLFAIHACVAPTGSVETPAEG
jgi:acyl-CoA reductase-like NAD-dependent aldehyde dehydrogenase